MAAESRGKNLSRRDGCVRSFWICSCAFRGSSSFTGRSAPLSHLAWLRSLGIHLFKSSLASSRTTCAELWPVVQRTAIWRS
ncbi:hypothetical protein SynBIOSE41_01732 [Synechococcus sp. BIOS-E4-1]|nr:hypothetical protein SynBIOSE41_01732 [Synechococcus sp. BIOS-E4-1]